jgi:type II restriction/modification system DNA methylase subunit YeeA
MLPEEQRKGGAHYTSERNILKTIHPLFLDDLRAEFVKIRDSKSSQRPAQLQWFLDKLAKLTFFDPACGCGNFLILAYRELRLLETEVLVALYPANENMPFLDVKKIQFFSKVDVDQFYGIEIEEFAARIAETAIYLVDHQMNVKLGALYGDYFARLPLKKSAHIHHGNALTTDWKTVIAPEHLSYILGNPPFVGSKYLSEKQRDEMAAVFGGIKGAGVLDYVTAWFFKASQYIQGTDIKVAFVSTNSITQGEQVSVLWQPLLQKYGIHIHFAHRTFKWTLDEKRARGMTLAAVYVVIIGFAAHDTDHKTLFDYETITSDPVAVPANNINPYLVDAATVLVEKRGQPLCNVPEMKFGNQPIDGGGLLLSEQEYTDFLKTYPESRYLIRQYMGAEEFINGGQRYCFWLKDVAPDEIKSCPVLLQKIKKVKEFRLSSRRLVTQNLAETPSLFAFVSHQENAHYILVPRVSSEKRMYLPVGFLKSDIIASDSTLIVLGATSYHFGVLTSLIHNAWMRQVAGRLKSDYRYSNTVVYNNFPWPTPTPPQETDIAEKAQAILAARAQFPSSTLADLYDPLTMPPVLLRAHQALDRAVDAAYRRAPFTTERERVAFLFERYQGLVAPLVPKDKMEKRVRKVRK